VDEVGKTALELAQERNGLDENGANLVPLDLLEIQSGNLTHDVSQRLGDLKHLLSRLLVLVATGI